MTLTDDERMRLAQDAALEVFQRVAGELVKEPFIIEIFTDAEPPVWGSLLWDNEASGWRIFLLYNRLPGAMFKTLCHELGHLLHGDVRPGNGWDASELELYRDLINRVPGAQTTEFHKKRAARERPPWHDAMEDAADAYAEACRARYWPEVVDLYEQKIKEKETKE